MILGIVKDGHIPARSGGSTGIARRVLSVGEFWGVLLEGHGLLHARGDRGLQDVCSIAMKGTAFVGSSNFQKVVD